MQLYIYLYIYLYLQNFILTKMFQIICMTFLFSWSVKVHNHILKNLLMYMYLYLLEFHCMDDERPREPAIIQKT